MGNSRGFGISGILRSYHARTLRTLGGRGRCTALLGRKPLFRSTRGCDTREILLPVNVPLPKRTLPHGTCAQLHDRRCAVAFHAYEWQERVAAHGLGRLWTAGRERRNGQWGTPG